MISDEEPVRRVVECALPAKNQRLLMSTIDDRLNQIISELISSGITLDQAVEAFEGKYIAAAMSANRGNVTRASRVLGIHRNTLHNKLRTQSVLSGYVASIRPRKRNGSKRSEGNGRARQSREAKP